MVTRSSDLWIWRPRPNPDALLRLFCFPYAGGGTVIFRTWPDSLPEDVEVCSVRLPRRESRLREPPFDRCAPLVQTLAEAMLPYLNKPFAFFGHSMGALIAFELARYLRGRRNLVPHHLFVSGGRAPQLGFSRARIHQLPEDEFIQALRRFNGTPDEVLQNEEILGLLLPTLRADFAICEEYIYTPDAPLECPISTYGGQSDPEVREKELRAWREQTCGEFTLQLFPGNHFFLHTAHRQLLRAIAGELSGLPNLSFAAHSGAGARKTMGKSACRA